MRVRAHKTRHVCRSICPHATCVHLTVHTPCLVQAVNRTTCCRNPKFVRIASQSTKKEGLNPGSGIRKIAPGKSIDSSGQWSSSGGRAVASGGRASRTPSAVPKSLGHLFPTVSRPRNSRCATLRLFAERLQARRKRRKTLTKQRFPKNQRINALARRASIRRFVANRCFGSVLRRFLCAGERSANSNKI